MQKLELLLKKFLAVYEQFLHTMERPTNLTGVWKLFSAMDTPSYVFICILHRYEQHLRTVKINGIRKGATTGAFLGFLFLIIFCAYALVRVASSSFCLFLF